MFIEINGMQNYGNIFPFESFLVLFNGFFSLKGLMLVFHVNCLDLHPKYIGM
jgi:hypothetical protein